MRPAAGGGRMNVPDVLAMSLQAILANRLRSVLTLVGIVAGGASSIGVMTGIAVVQAARPVAVIGHAIARKLFPFTDPTGRDIRIDGRRYQVVGVFDEKKSAFGGNFDNYVLMPVSTYVNTYGLKDRNGFLRSVNITVRARTPAQINDAIEQTRQVLRRVRGLKPKDEDNFEFFNSQSLITQFNKVSMGVKLGAFVIGTIALIVAGIGTMNIMLVAVTERTREIGIRKALGARSQNILAQFLFEAVVLCNIGGVFGVIFGFGLGNLVSVFTKFDATVPLEWAVIGLVFCSAVGIAFGPLPAMRPARPDPIDAPRYA